MTIVEQLLEGKVSESAGAADKKMDFRRIRKSDVLTKYKPIADYGIIGDMKTCALVGLDGSIDWLCVPRFDSGSVFGALLDIRRGGSFRINPASNSYESRQYYVPRTNILVTEFRTTTGIASVTDFMPCFQVEGSLVSSGEIHRVLNCLEGSMELEVKLQPRFDYGRVVPHVELVKDLCYSFASNEGPSSRQRLALISCLQMQEGEGSLQGSMTLEKGRPFNLSLRYGGSEVFHSSELLWEAKLEETCTFWRRWASKCKYRGKWRETVLRSALALKLLVFSPTGATIAAATTSLPESLGGSRNWDYRYSWVRDSSFVMWALLSLGYKEEVKSYRQWLASLFYLTGGNLQIMLGVGGERDLSEYTLGNLEGYLKSSPVRVGNAAWNQFQLDVFGILLDAIYFSHKHISKLRKKSFSYLIKPTMNKLIEVWDKPDSGIWEVRTGQKQFVYSKMWSWVAADRACKIANELGQVKEFREWSQLRDKVKSDILSKGYDKELGSFVRSYGSKEVDSANLLMPQVHFLPANNPLMKSTIEVTTKKLLVNGKYMYRYLADDGLPGKEGAFLICSFWLVNCLARLGKLKEAEDLMDSLVKDANHLGLFSEEIDPKTTAFLGNFPQAFTHMGFITSATTLGRVIQRKKSKDKVRA